MVFGRRRPPIRMRWSGTWPHDYASSPATVEGPDPSIDGIHHESA
jgi:hypothetical protein